MATRLIDSEDIPEDIDKAQMAMDCTGVVYSGRSDTYSASAVSTY